MIATIIQGKRSDAQRLDRLGRTSLGMPTITLEKCREDLEALNELNFLDATAVAREHGFRHQIRDFLLAIDGGTPPSPSFEDGLKVQRILHAVEKSANNKSTLTVVNH